MFGGQRLTAGPEPHGRPLSIPSLHTRSLLAYLALHPGQPIDRHQLAFLLWGDELDEVALRYLRQHLHRLRQSFAELRLPDDALRSQAGRLHFLPEAGLWIDTLEFERRIAESYWQIEVLELYEGDLLPEMEAEWIRPFRRRFRDQYLEALRAQIHLATSEHNYPRALHYARRLLDANPMRESSHRIYMEALYLSGKRVQALNHFSELQDLLKDELNARPMPQTVELHRQMKMGTFSYHRRQLGPLSGPTRRRAEATHEISRAVTGRREALALLNEALGRARSGEGLFVLIEGAPGLGKTHLLDKWRRARAGEMLAFAATCEPGEPLGWPVLAALRHRREQIDWNWFPSQLSWLQPIQAAIQTGRPACDDAPATMIQEANLDENLRQFTLMLVQRARQIVAFCLDDLHYADEVTWSTLSFLARRSHRMPLLLIATCQPDLLSAEKWHLIRSLQRYDQLTVIQLQPLSEAETRRLALQFFPAEAVTSDFLQLLYQTAEGNPLFTVELLKTVQESEQAPAAFVATPLRLPRTIDAALSRRLGCLDAEGRHLLAEAAGIGRRFHFRALADAAPHVSDRKILEEINRWLQHGLVQEQTEGYAFTHEQIRLAAQRRR